MTGRQTADWVVLRHEGALRWGSEARRRGLFGVLAQRTHARVVGLWPLLGRRGNRPPLRWIPRSRTSPRPLLAASEQPPHRARDLVEAWTRPFAVAIYDDPVAQSAALGMAIGEDRAASAAARLAGSVELFDWLVVPTRSFADLAGLPSDRVLVAGSGTDTQVIQPGPWPDVPSIGMVSGAAPGRGIEALVEAARLLRAEHPGLVLRLFLVPTSADSMAYLAGLRRAVAAEPWIRIASVARDQLGDALAAATVLAIPHPDNAYMDVALPVKLFDSLAAGRPLVVTPRVETAAVVRETGAGVVAPGDTAADLASAIGPLLSDRELARRLGSAGRSVAVERYDWRVVGGRVAEQLLERAGGAE